MQLTFQNDYFRQNLNGPKDSIGKKIFVIQKRNAIEAIEDKIENIDEEVFGHI
jgi:hypothetical protein